MHAIILYQHRVRELQSCERLARELEKRGFRTSVLNIDWEMGRACWLAARAKIDLVVTPWMYVESNYEHMYPFVRSNPDVVIVNLHQEQIGSQVSSRFLIPKGQAAKESVFHFTWGSAFAQALRDCGVPDELIRVTGNLRNDDMRAPLLSREDLAAQFGLDADKKWLLFAESRGWVYTYNSLYEAGFLRQCYTRQELEEFKSVTQESLDRTIEQFEALETSFFSDAELIYRPHPGTLPPTLTNSSVRVIADHGIGDWLAAIDFIAVWGSTTIYEAEIVGVPGVVFEPVPNPPKYQTAGLHAFPVIEQFTEVKDLMNSPGLPRSKNYLPFYGEADGHATERVADACAAVVADPGSYRATPVRLSRSLVRTLLAEAATRVVAPLGVIDRYKWPRSAHSHRADIPYYHQPDQPGANSYQA